METILSRFINSLNDMERFEVIKQIVGNGDLIVFDWDNNKIFELEDISNVSMNGPSIQITINNKNNEV